MIGAFRVTTHQPGAVLFLLFFRELRCAVYRYFKCRHLFQPFHCTVVAILAYLRHLLRIVNTEQVIHGDIYRHHQYKLIAGRAFGLEYGISVISCTEISAHFGNGTVLADLNDGVIITGQGIQYFAMDAGIVILRSYKFTHGYNRLGFRRSLRCITVTGTSC